MGADGAAEKSPEAFRTISEVSEALDLPQHVLRFWETRFTQIKPMKRSGGRRLYRPDHVALLRGIKALLYDDGMTIKGVQKVLREQGARTVIARGTGEVGAADADGVLALDLPDGAAARLDDLRARARGAPSGVDAARIEQAITRLEGLLARLEAPEAKDG